MTLRKYYGYDRNALLESAAAMRDIDSACLVIQRAIGQNDGGAAGVFFSDVKKISEFEESKSTRDRALLMSEYLDFEYAMARA